jgi:hypothetical protein
MSTATLRSAPHGRAASGDGEGSGRALWIVVALLVAALAFLVAWLLGWISFGTDPRVAEIRALQEAARARFADNGGPRTLAEATEAVTAMNTIRAKVEGLPPHLRPQVERAGGSMFRSAMRSRIDAYFSLPPEKRKAELDRQIDQEEMMRKAFEAGSAIAGAFGAGGAGAGQTAGQAGGGPGGGPPGGPRGGGTEEDRNRFRKSIIDRTTPEQRARYVEYRRAIDERREQRGLPSGGRGM